MVVLSTDLEDDTAVKRSLLHICVAQDTVSW